MQTSPQRRSGSLVARPSRERVGAGAPTAKIRSSPLGSARQLGAPGGWRRREAGSSGNRRTGDSADRDGAGGADGADGGGLGPHTASSAETPSAGVSASVGEAYPRARGAVGRCGDGSFGSKRSASWSSEHGTGSQRLRSTRSLVAGSKPRWMTDADKKPHEWQRSSRPQRGRGANRRGSEKLRGRNVPGEASPGGADPVTDVAEGAPNPTRGTGDLGLRSAVRLVP